MGKHPFRRKPSQEHIKIIKNLNIKDVQANDITGDE